MMMVSCGLFIFWLYLCPCDFSQKPFCKQLKKACSLGSCQIVWTTGHNWMVVNSVEGVQSNGKWHNNEIYIDCYQYFDDHDHTTTNTTPYIAVNNRWLSELEFQVSFTMWKSCAAMISWVGWWVECYQINESYKNGNNRNFLQVR